MNTFENEYQSDNVSNCRENILPKHLCAIILSTFVLKK